MADYASISISNSRLFRTVEERARSLESMAGSAQTGEKINHQILMKVKNELRTPLAEALSSLEKLAKDPTARWNPDQRQELSRLQDNSQAIGKISDAIIPPRIDQTGSGRSAASYLTWFARRCSAFEGFARQSGLALILKSRMNPVLVQADPGHCSGAGWLINNALKFSNPGGKIVIRVEKSTRNRPMSWLATAALVWTANKSRRCLTRKAIRKCSTRECQRFGGLGVNLALVKEIITQQKGKIWVESQPGAGTTFHFTLPMNP